MGLYNGLGAKEIQAKKGLKKAQNILDHMGSTELAANYSGLLKQKKN
jgi:DNA-damage-inducible protein D